MPDRQPHDQRVANGVLRAHRDVIMRLARLASAQSTNRETFFPEVARRVADALEVDHVKLMRFRRDRGDLVLEAGVGWREGLGGSTAFPSDLASPCGRAFQTGQPVSIENIDEAQDFRIDPILREHGIVALLNVPILVDGAAWGVLEVDSTVVRGFSPDTEEFLVAAANLLGLMVTRTRAERAHLDAVAAAALQAQQRSLLLTEMQHRVKNNFQTILAMILLQSRKAAPECHDVLQGLADRVLAMSLAHEQLSPTQAGDVVELAAYLRALVGAIKKPFEGLTIDLEANEMTASIDQAVPLGLIVNEAVTNAVKHAFDGQAGAVRVELLDRGRGEALLSICDNGRGLDAATAGGGSGSRLLDDLARQLRGRLERESRPGEGVLIRVTFPRLV